MPSTVHVRRDRVTFPTYEPAAPDRNPMFLEKRVYQGSRGTVYPLPFTDRVAEQPTPRAWDAVHLENEFVYVMILPELGGRIHVGRDKTNGYDFFYRQDVIKPALVGLAGPWISGGVEFNWPQHHRPSTFLPADMHIENHDDGAVTVWLSEHDPMARMKGMHGVCLRPGSAAIELKARAYNRTPHPQTFLWWANVATRVHEQYQSFFPPDVTFVADHAKRATSTFPRATGHYYGVNYGERGRTGIPSTELPRQFLPNNFAPTPASNFKLPTSPSNSGTNYSANDLSWYANIPVPTSYMAMGSAENFFGGYDHAAQAGVVHVANHHISPGKKQWTWGNHEFGYAWDRNLTDPDAAGVCHPYIEIMAGVYTDNQPDFSFLQPGETKSWSQFWYPIQKIGPAQHANSDAALALALAREGKKQRARLGVAVAATFADARIELLARGKPLATFTRDLAPDAPFVEEVALAATLAETDVKLRVVARDGREIIAYSPKAIVAAKPADIAQQAATEPPAPRAVASADELFLIGQHLAQYRHATRCPTLYWREALRRDAGDSRGHTALGKWHLQRGEFVEAEEHFRAAIVRLTSRNPNPADGEALYHLGLTLRYRAFAETIHSPQSVAATLSASYAAFYKATWNHAWTGAAYHALAEIDCARGDWATALDHLDRALRLNTDNLKARDLRALVLRRLDRDADAARELRATLALDPLDWWARDLAGETLACDNQVRLDLAHDYVRAGFFAEALRVLDGAPKVSANPTDLGTAPLVAYTAAWICRLAATQVPALTRRATSSGSPLREQRDNDTAQTIATFEAPTTAAGWLALARRFHRAARRASPDYCFPARLEELLVLESALAADARDPRAALFLGHWLYDRRRHPEAIARWEHAAKHEARNAVAWRCLGLGYFNILRQPRRARAAYDRACRANPRDARLLFERDQLAKRLGDSPAKRLRELQRRLPLVRQRDDLSVEFCTLLNQTGQSARALEILTTRRFQPWEGGEGSVLAQHTRAHVALGRAALAAGRTDDAVAEFTAAFSAPANLGEARHLLANHSDLHVHLGEALAAAGRLDDARTHWTAAAEFRGDFQEMSVRAFSEMTYFSALALRQLGRGAAARKLLRGLLAYARKLARTPAKIDYFATSLPTMLLFDDDLDARQQTAALFLEAQARLGLGEGTKAERLLREVLRRDPNHALAAELLAANS